MSDLDPRLAVALRKVAALAMRREHSAPHAADPDLQLFAVRRFIGSASGEAITMILRQLIEVASGRTLTVRWASHAVSRSQGFMTPDGYVTCVLCPFGTAEGRLEQVSSGMFVFSILGGDPGYRA